MGGRRTGTNGVSGNKRWRILARKVQEWLAVTLAGAVGGLANAVQAGNLRVPWFSRTQGKTPELDPGLFRSVMVGAVAGLAMWNLNSSDATFATVADKVQPVLGALLAGFGGGKALATALEQPKRDEVANNALATVENLAEGAASALEGGS